MSSLRTSGRKKATSAHKTAGEHSQHSESSDDDNPVKPQKRASGKLRAVKNETADKSSTLVKSIRHGASKKVSTSGPSATNGKRTAKEETKAGANAKPIYSFFNAVTQNQRTPQAQALQEKRAVVHQQPEAIYDESGDETTTGLQFSKGSSTAMTVKKRKVQHSESFDDDGDRRALASQKYLKSTYSKPKRSLTTRSEDTRPWTELFAPRDISELAVHKRKIADVRQWLETTLRGRRQKVLVLKGAAGTGKTTSVKLLASELGLAVIEWRNPTDTDLGSERSGASMQFADFVGRAGQSSGLQFVGNGHSEATRRSAVPNSEASTSQPVQQLLLVEEFPSTFSRSSTSLLSFRSTILQYLSSRVLVSTPTPIIMVVSETLLSTNTAAADSFTAHRLLGPELANHPFLNIIEFNPVAPTILSKAIDTVILKEARKSGRRKQPGPRVLQHLAEAGDLRSAVSSLEFLALRGDEDELWSGKVTFTKPKKSKSEPPLTRAEEDALKLIHGRESTIGIFHSVGKVVYNKRIQPLSPAVDPPPWFPQHRRPQIPENEVDRLIDEVGTDTATFVAGLHENYVLSCGAGSLEDTINCLAGCADSISDADLLSVDRFSSSNRAFSVSATDTLRQDETAFQTAVRGLYFHLPCPVNRIAPRDGKSGDAYRMFYPSSLRLWRKTEEIEGLVSLLTTMLIDGLPTNSTGQTRNAKAGSHRGVETWKGRTSFAAQAPSQLSSAISGGAETVKTEMLLERLPYIAQIMRSRTPSLDLLDRISAVVTYRGSRTDKDDEEADDGSDDDVSQEHWTTDRPEEVPSVGKSKMKSKLKTDARSNFAGLVTTEPMENHDKSAILEDDPIEDD